MRSRCSILLVVVAPIAVLFAIASCGSIPNDPDDVEVADIVGTWVLRNAGGDVAETVRFFDTSSPPPVTSPYSEDGQSYGPALNFLWQIEAQGTLPFETLYGTYSLGGTTQIRLLIVWVANENNTLVRSIPPGQRALAFSITGDTLLLEDVPFTRQP